MFESTISLGNLLTILIMIGSGMAVVWATRTELQIERTERTAATRRLDKIEIELRTIIDRMETLARQDERINSLDRRIAALEGSGRRRGGRSAD